MLVNGMVYGLGFTTPSLTQTSTECDSWSMMSSLPNPELQVCVGIGYQYVCGFHSTGQDLYKSELACNNSVYIWNDAVNIFEDGRSQKSPKVRALSTMRPKNIQAWKQRGSWRNFGTGKKNRAKNCFSASTWRRYFPCLKEAPIPLIPLAANSMTSVLLVAADEKDEKNGGP